MDLPETRELAYFVAVAEELHFGRAATRLGLTQPPLSRTIRQLERRIGTELFVRTSRSVALTAAGATLLHEARVALGAATAAVNRTRRAAQPHRKLTLALKPGCDAGLLGPTLNRFHAVSGGVEVELIFTVSGGATLVRTGVADAALLHRPWHDLTGFDTEDLLVESQIAILPADHELAGVGDLHLRDLAGYPTPRWPDGLDKGATGPEVSDVGQLMQLIALRKVIAVAPESAREHVRQDLVTRPVVDAPPTTLTLAWPEHSRRPDLASFVRIAAEVARERTAA